jgi:hypothetical protein
MFRAFLVTTPDMGSDAHRGVDVAFADGVTTVYPAIKFSRNHQVERAANAAGVTVQTAPAIWAATRSPVGPNDLLCQSVLGS